MGWLFGHQSYQRLVSHLTKDWGTPASSVRCLKRFNYGHTTLWTLFERTTQPTATDDPDAAPEVIRFAIQFLIRGSRSGSEMDWGYKDIDLAAGPRIDGFPLSWLPLLTWDCLGRDPEQTLANVRRWHAQRGTGVSLVAGQQVQLYPNGSGFTTATVVQVRPLRARVPDGMTFYLKRGMIDFTSMAATAQAAIDAKEALRNQLEAARLAALPAGPVVGPAYQSRLAQITAHQGCLFDAAA